MMTKMTSKARRAQLGKLLAAVAVCLLLFSGLSDTLAINTYVHDLKGLAVPVQSYSIQEKAVALTFDVGASSTEQISEILQQLRDARVHATFFLTGEWVQKYPRTAAEIVRQGHEVGQSLYRYEEPSSKSAGELRADLVQADDAWQQAGLPVSALFRIPFAKNNATLAKAIHERQATLIGWSINLSPQPGHVMEANWDGLASAVRSGDILRLRTDGDAVHMLPQLLKTIREAGYEWRTCTALQGGVRS